MVIPNCLFCVNPGTYCFICKPGFWNTTCNSSCLPNCAECTKKNGKCERCMPEYWGENCENRCTVKHCQYCYQNGSCEQCNSGFWGEACDKRCVRRHCSFCHKTSGMCERCEDGYWGQFCENKCGEVCADNRCEKITGLCVNYTSLYWDDAWYISMTEPSSIKSADGISGKTIFSVSSSTFRLWQQWEGFIVYTAKKNTLSVLVSFISVSYDF